MTERPNDTVVATALLRAEHPVVAWNRTRDRTAAVRSPGARVVADPAEAVAAAGLTLVSLTDHDGVRALLGSLPRASSPGVVAVLSTGTPEDAMQAAALVHERGLEYVDVGLQASPDAIGTPDATLLYSGPRAVVDAHHETLAVLGPVTWVGENASAAAVWDLALLGLWYDAQLGLLRALDQVTAAGVPAIAFAEAARGQLGHVVDAAVSTADEVAQRHYPRGPATLAEHAPVLDRLRSARADGRLGDGGLAPVAELVVRLVDRGHGDLGLSALVDEQLLA